MPEGGETSSVFSFVVLFPICKPECTASRTVCLNFLYLVCNGTEALYLTSYLIGEYQRLSMD